MTAAILMIHGVGGTGEAFSKLAPAFRALGWRVETPTLRPHLRTKENPPAALPQLRLKDYVDDMEALARTLEAETGVKPVVFGHSMGGLVTQKLAERGVLRGAVLLTPASPADARTGPSLAQAVTFANVLFSAGNATKAHKIWRTGFSWGVLNRVDQAKHAGIYAETVYDSGGVFEDLAYPDRDPHRIAFIDESKITAPVLVIGGGKDRATPIGGVRLVAKKYDRIGGEYREYPDNAHWIVDEPGTDAVIADIVAWLAAKGLTPAVAAPAPVTVAEPAATPPSPPSTPVLAQAAKPKSVPKAKAAKPAAPAPSPKPMKPKAKPAPKAVAEVSPAPEPAKVKPVTATKAPPKPKAAKSSPKAPAQPATPPEPAKSKAAAPAKAAPRKAPVKPAVAAKPKTTSPTPKAPPAPPPAAKPAAKKAAAPKAPAKPKAAPKPKAK